MWREEAGCLQRRDLINYGREGIQLPLDLCQDRRCWAFVSELLSFDRLAARHQESDVLLQRLWLDRKRMRLKGEGAKGREELQAEMARRRGKEAHLGLKEAFQVLVRADALHWHLEDVP